jgi:glycosyltransferase involved in cell wall biosynthesis
MDMWKAEDVGNAGSRGEALALVRRIKSEGRPAILALGRWEPGCYKNSAAAIEVVEKLRHTHPGASLFVLANAHDLPSTAGIHALGFPDDAEMADIMRECDLGICTSLWEGFNLPLAEMQWVGRPVLVFDVGAHPEVAMHPWFLCRDTSAMVHKASELLSGRGLDVQERERAHQKFRQYFTWERSTADIVALLNASRAPRVSLPPDHRLLIDVTNSTRDPANSGVIRVTRRLSRTLQQFIDPLFVVWHEPAQTYVFPTAQEFEQLAAFHGPSRQASHPVSETWERRFTLESFWSAKMFRGGWLLLPETTMTAAFGEILKLARRLRLRVASIFHDAIPILRPDLCNEEMRLNHRGYIGYLAQTDVVMPNSNFSAQSLRDVWVKDRIPATRIATNVLPAEFSGAERNLEPPPAGTRKTVSVLCVSTLEPRKNHLKLIEACLRMGADHPELDWKLTLVGNKYAGALDLADKIQHIARENPRIQWLGIVDDEKLCRLYRESTFTVYPSIIEGFGMPILESVWHARPCLCFNQGVMAEIAAEGGCLTIDVTDVAAFADALSRLATDAELRADLSVQATRRTLKTWTEYASQLMGTLAHATPAYLNGNSGNLENLLYPVCLTEKWQMQDSERVGLTGLLERIRPACSIEIGTFHGGSLSLITQYSKAVFSIDIDATVPMRMPAFANPNVRYLIGRSQEILPTLLAELDEAGLFPEFVLVDGDHSAEGVQRDFEMLLDYVPKRPLVVLAHDSFNPGCRAGMLAVGWQRSPHVHEVDLDFVPGRITNLVNGQRELWGGFALAYLNPRVREGPLHIRRSADSLFDACTKYLQSC